MLSQMLTLFTTPVIYLALDKFRRGRHPTAVAAVFAGLASVAAGWGASAAGLGLREAAVVAVAGAAAVFALVRLLMGAGPVAAGE